MSDRKCDIPRAISISDELKKRLIDGEKVDVWFNGDEPITLSMLDGKYVVENGELTDTGKKSDGVEFILYKTYAMAGKG